MVPNIYDINEHGFIWDYDSNKNEWNLISHSQSNLETPHFTINEPTDVTLWNMGNWVSIKWTSLNHKFSSVKIVLYTNHNEIVRYICHSCPDNGYIDWLVDIPTYYSVDTFYEIRIYSTGFDHLYQKNRGYIKINHMQ